MSSISEFALFKECVHNPRFLDHNLSQLNLQFIRDPAAPESSEQVAGIDSLEVNQRKALRLFYMVWSAVTKCLRNMVQHQKKAIEIKNFAIFGPIAEANQGRDPNDKGFANTQASLKLGMCPVFAVINDEFLNDMNWEVALDQTSDKAVGRYSRQDKKEVNDLFKNKIQPLSVSSIASVCLTDVATVDNVIKEFTSSLGELARAGKTLRLNFKVGYLSVSNQLVQWQHSRELLRRHNMAQSTAGSSRGASSMASQRPSEAISVMTPSIARYSRATSTDHRQHHMANPNPQGTQMNFYGPRDLNKTTGLISTTGGEGDLVRFGRRVNFGNKLTNYDLLEDHLKDMREHLIKKKAERNSQLAQDREFLNSVKKRDQLEAETKMRSTNMLKNEFLFFNDQKQLDKKLKQDEETQERTTSKLDYFPFISGELLEQHRKGLSGMMQADMKNYLIAKSQGLVAPMRETGRFSAQKSISSGNSLISPTLDGHIDLRNDRLTRNVPVKPSQIVKQLNDSCYLAPEKNYRVIQDDDPIKKNAALIAQQLADKRIAQAKNFNQTVMSAHFGKIQSDQNNFSQDRETLRQKRQRFKLDMQNQMEQNNMQKSLANEERRERQPTSFGPTEDEEVAARHRVKAETMRKTQNFELTQQMKDNMAYKEMQRKSKLITEAQIVDENIAALTEMKANKQRIHSDKKQFWQNYLDSNTEVRRKEKDAEEVLKKTGFA